MGDSKKIMNIFVREIIEFETETVFYRDTDSLYTEQNHWEVLDKFLLAGDILCRGKNDY